MEAGKGCNFETVFKGDNTSGPTLTLRVARSGVCCTGPYFRRKPSRLAPLAPYVGAEGSTVPVSAYGLPSGEDFVGVEVPTSRLRTEMRGSMNFVLYSERTCVYRVVLSFCCPVENLIRSDNLGQ